MIDAGDRVRCINASMSSGLLTSGGIYTVSVSDHTEHVMLAEDDQTRWWGMYRFEKIAGFRLDEID